MPTSSAAGAALGLLGKVAFSALLVGAVILLGQVPLGRPSGESIVRLALRTVQGRIEVCRQATAEELAGLPQHMRRSEICERTAVTYRLRVALDGLQVVDERVEPGGLRRDRPHIVDRQIEAPPGKTRLQITFEPDPGAAGGAAAAALAAVPGYSFDEEIELREDRISLVLLDDAAGRLVVYDGS